MSWSSKNTNNMNTNDMNTTNATLPNQSATSAAVVAPNIPQGPTAITLKDAKGRVITNDLDLRAFARFSPIGYTIQRTLDDKTRTHANAFIVYDAHTTTVPPELAAALLTWMTQNKDAEFGEQLPYVIDADNNDYSVEEALGMASIATAFRFRPQYLLYSLENVAFNKLKPLITSKPTRVKAETIALMLGLFPPDNALLHRVMNKLAATVVHRRDKSSQQLDEIVNSAIEAIETTHGKQAARAAYNEALAKQRAKMEAS